MKSYTKPKIYKPQKGRWYIYYYYDHPTHLNKNGRPLKVRFNCPSLGLNTNNNSPTEKNEKFKALRDAVEILLQRGYNPFDNKINSDNSFISADSAINYALGIKENSVSSITYGDYLQKSKFFKKFLDKRGYLHTDVKEISRQLCLSFLNEISENSSNRNRNNYKTCLSALFSLLEDEEYLEKNHFKTIKNLKSEPNSHKAYTDKDAELILNKLDEFPNIKLYVEITGMGFLRPVEACRIKVKDINIDEAIWYFDAKNKKGKRKRIPNILLVKIKNLDLSNPNAFLLTNKGVAETPISPEQRRSTFTKKHQLIIKSLGFGKEYDVYSWRHYYTYKVYNELRKKYNYSKAMDELQNITGHKTRQALMKYLRTIDAEIADDYSELLT